MVKFAKLGQFLLSKDSISNFNYKPHNPTAHLRIQRQQVAGTHSSLVTKENNTGNKIDHSCLHLAGIVSSSFCHFRHFTVQESNADKVNGSCEPSLPGLLESLFQDFSKHPIHTAPIYKTDCSLPMLFRSFHWGIHTTQKGAFIHKSSTKGRHGTLFQSQVQKCMLVTTVSNQVLKQHSLPGLTDSDCSMEMSRETACRLFLVFYT